MKQTLILGNIITMDDKRPFAKAALAKDGVFVYIGNAEEAMHLASPDAQVLDYGASFVYPGFLESHCHGHLAGYRAIGPLRHSNWRSKAASAAIAPLVQPSSRRWDRP